ncbi:MAG: FKBP-type peptidyl-prolyl cis-trans isomerase [Candidatus Cryptobacteroides sp.]
MKKSAIHIAILASAVLACGCAKSASTGPNDASIRYFNAWKTVNHPDAESTELGSIIIEKTDGDGKEIEAEGYAIAEYVVSDLIGNITSYTDAETAKQLGTYSETTYYGPQVLSTCSGYVYAGISEAIVGMKTGGHIKTAIPSWLMTYSIYDTRKEYENHSTEASDCIYDIRLVDYTDDIIQWQKDSIGRYFASHPEIFGDMTAADTLNGYSGIYYKQLKEAVDTTSFPTDTTIYINYTGRLLNGLVFDTTIERVAKDNGLYSASNSYAPVSVTWSESASGITLSSSSVITGFAVTLWQMRAMEKGIGVFTSDYGYGSSGSGSSIPGYCPLVFEIEIVEEPE